MEVSERARAALEERKTRLTAADLLRMLSALAELEQRFRKSGQQQLLLETLLVRFALLDRTVAIEDVLRGLGDGGSPGGGSRSSGSATSTSQGRGSDAPRESFSAPTTRRAAADVAPRPADRAVEPPIVRDQPSGPRASASPPSVSASGSASAPDDRSRP